ncbi:cytochrome P450 3A9-like [Oppia nitens]|uniref:cytochrome P450 3A9-like n=1 Tax=Oppia nitens TaxID=1686743 RepID=UPI0023DC38D0|nr:cytochrome P450 3A9-like [Oppia nitens]
MVLIADPDVAKQILVKDFQYFSERPDFFFSFNRPVMNGSLIKSRGQRWKQIRSVVTPTFSSAKLRTMTPLIDDSVNMFLKLVDKQQSTNGGNDFNIYNLFQGLTADVIGRTAFGIQTDIQLDSDNKFIKAVKNKLKSLSFFAKWHTLIRYCFPQLYRLLYPYRRLEELINHRLLGRSPTGILLDMCQQVIDLRKSNKKQNRKDLLQLMLETKLSDQHFTGLNVQQLTAGAGTDLQTNGVNCEVKVELKTNCQSKEVKHNDIQLTDDEIKANCVVFYEAGYETTSTALGFVAHILVNNQDIQDRVRQEVRKLYETDGRLDYNTVSKLEYMECVINETMRLYPPLISFVARETNADYPIGTNITIPKGTAVQFATYYMHHDPDYWPEPEKFDPERFSSGDSRRHPYSWQPFGSGPRNCVGIRLAYFEIKLCLAKLLFNYRLEPGPRTELGNITVKTRIISMNPKNGVFLKAIKLF